MATRIHAPKHLIFLFLSIIAQPVFAGVLGEKDVHRVLAYYQDLKKYKRSFTQVKKIRSLEVTLTSSGTLEVQRKPLLIVWKILKPSETTVTITDSEMSIVNDPGKPTEQTQQISLESLPKRENGDTQSFASLKAWLDLDPSAIAHDYLMQESAPDHYLFVPKIKAQSPFQKLEFKIKPGQPLETLTIHELSQDEITIQFSKVKF